MPFFPHFYTHCSLLHITVNIQDFQNQVWFFCLQNSYALSSYKENNVINNYLLSYLNKIRVSHKLQLQHTEFIWSIFSRKICELLKQVFVPVSILQNFLSAQILCTYVCVYVCLCTYTTHSWTQIRIYLHGYVCICKTILSTKFVEHITWIRKTGLKND